MDLEPVQRAQRRGSFGSGQYLRVLQEGWLVVGTAAAAVQQRIRVFCPASKVYDLVPGLMDANQGRIDDTADVSVREQFAPVCEGHPVIAKGKMPCYTLEEGNKTATVYTE